jgi:hypothetical protein
MSPAASATRESGVAYFASSSAPWAWCMQSSYSMNIGHSDMCRLICTSCSTTVQLAAMQNLIDRESSPPECQHLGIVKKCSRQGHLLQALCRSVQPRGHLLVLGRHHQQLTRLIVLQGCQRDDIAAAGLHKLQQVQAQVWQQQRCHAHLPAIQWWMVDCRVTYAKAHAASRRSTCPRCEARLDHRSACTASTAM